MENGQPSDMTADQATIMVIDDEPISIRTLNEILTTKGYRVRTETNAVAALKSVLTDSPDLILLDIKMPNMDGITFCKRLKEDTDVSHIPVIFISSLEKPEEKANAFDAGGSDYLTKPISGIELLARVRTHLNLSRLQYRLEQLVEQRTTALTMEITERYEAEKKLARIQRQHDEAQQIAHLGHWALNLTNNKLSWSDENYRIFGAEPGTVNTYETFLQRVHPDDYTFVDETYTNSVKNRTSYNIDHRLLMKDGSIKWVNERCETTYAEDGTPLHSLGTTLDITERKQTKEKLAESEARLSGILESAAEAVISIDESQRITLFNKSAEKVFGYRLDEVLGQPLDILIPKKYHRSHRAEIAKFSKTQEQSRHMASRNEIEGVRKNGEAFPIEASISKVELNGHKTYTAVLRDISSRKQNEKRLRLAFVESIDTLVRAAEYRDDETGAHVKRICYYTKILAETLGMDDHFCDEIFHASAMHDIGKIGIPDHILLKPHSFTPDEWELMKTHTIIGSKILADHSSPYLRLGQQIALSHHERWDGSGYPNGLKGEAIPLAARIMQLADVYDALRSERPYKKALDHKKAFEIITKGDGRTDPSHFDPKVLEAFKNCADTLNRIFEDHREGKEF